MQLVNVLIGKNSFLVLEKLNEKISSTKVEEINIVTYDLLENSSDDVIEDLRTVSFFSENKVVIVKNLDSLLKADELSTNDWIKYLDKPNPEVFLFIVLNEMLDENSVLGKAIFKRAFIEKIDDLSETDFPVYIKKMVKKLNFEITDKACRELLERTNYDLNLIKQELDKLMLYNFNSLSIDVDSVILLVSRNLEENIYELTNNLIEGNNSKVIEIYYDLLARNEDPIKIMNSIVGKIKETIHTKILLEKGYTQDEIANHFNIKTGRAFYLIKKSNMVSFERLEDFLTKLSKLDLEIKTGKIDKKIGLEIFILGA